MHANIAVSPRVRRSPYHEATIRHGASVFTVYNHMFLPMGYEEEPGREYRNVVEGVQLWDVACERQVEIKGPDALRFAQLLTPRDLSRIAVGQAAYALVTNEAGGILNDPVVLRLAEDRFWFSLADNDILLWAQGVAAAGSYDVDISEPDVSPLQVQGPRSVELVARVFGDVVSSLPFYRFRRFDLDGIPLVIGRMGYSHERCFELFLCDGNRGDELWERLWAAGSDLGISAGSPNPALRVEAGIYSYLADMDATTNPFEIGLGWTVQLDCDDPFIGREALERASGQEPERRLLGAEIEGPPIWNGNPERWKVNVRGRVAGYLTSSAWSPRFERNLGFVMLDSAIATPGGQIEICDPAGPRPARLVALPWTKRQR